jgi:hypothetical protein
MANASWKSVAYALALLASFLLTTARAETGVAPAEARAIAKEVYIYGYPMVDSYRILHAYFVDRDNPEYKGPWNQSRNFSRVFTPEDKAVQTPNSDTPYSFLGMDLRVEPIVLAPDRTQLFGPGDIENVQKVQSGYRVAALALSASTFGRAAGGHRAPRPSGNAAS